MAEFLVALVCIMALFVGLLQIASLTATQNRTLVEARREAAEQAMSDPAVLGTADYIEEVLVGDDGSAYSVDDEYTDGSESDFTMGLVDLAAADAASWNIIDGVPGNQVSAIHDTSVPTFEMQMVSGDDGDTVPLISAVQKLLYDAEEIDVESEVWMPWIRGIY